MAYHLNLKLVLHGLLFFNFNVISKTLFSPKLSLGACESLCSSRKKAQSLSLYVGLPLENVFFLNTFDDNVLKKVVGIQNEKCGFRGD